MIDAPDPSSDDVRSQPHTGVFQLDLPILSREQDELNRSQLAASIANGIARWDSKSGSLVLAVYGRWGTGKTSLKNLIVEELEHRVPKVVTIVEYNPWRWSSLQEITVSFISSIAKQITSADPSQEKRAAKLFLFVSSITRLVGSGVKVSGTVLKMAGVPGGEIANQLGDFLVHTTDVSEHSAKAIESSQELYGKDLEDLRNELKALMQELRQPILVIIDDLDRLTSQEIQTMFQLIKANSDFPSLAFLVLCQRETVEQSLNALVHGAQETETTGRKFLSKIVHFGVELPVVRKHELAKKVTEKLEVMLRDAGVNFHYSALQDAIFAVMPYFDSFRDVHRFLTAYCFQVGMLIETEGLSVNPIDLIFLEAIRIHEPDVHRALAYHGRLAIDNGDNRLVSAAIELASKTTRGTTEGIVKSLFSAVSDIQHPLDREPDIHQQKRICTYGPFDSYFSHLT